MNTIKPGYMIQITSWENDADAYRTIVKDGLSVTVAKFFIEFAELFKKPQHDGGLAANAYNSNDVKWPELTAAVRALFAKYPGVDKELWGDNDGDDDDDDIDFMNDDDAADTIYELAYDLFGSSEYQFRVFSGYVAYYIPQEIQEHKFDFTEFGE